MNTLSDLRKTISLHFVPVRRHMWRTIRNWIRRGDSCSSIRVCRNSGRWKASWIGWLHRSWIDFSIWISRRYHAPSLNIWDWCLYSRRIGDIRRVRRRTHHTHGVFWTNRQIINDFVSSKPHFCQFLQVFYTNPWMQSIESHTCRGSSTLELYLNYVE